MTGRYRYIMYASQDIPCNPSFDLSRVASLDNARREYARFCDAVGTDECSARLYAYSDEAWESAEQFRDVGCPFDYPDYVIERGALNGIRVSHA